MAISIGPKVAGCAVSASSRAAQARGALQAAIQIILVLVVFATLQFLASRHNVRHDLSPNQRYLLSPYARQAAESFPFSATFYAFYDSQQVIERRHMLDLLDQIHAYAPDLSYELVDLDRKPGLAKKYGVSTYNTGVLELEDGKRYPVRAVNEQALTAILLRLTRKTEKRACFATGHGESSPANRDERLGLSSLSDAMRREGLSVQTILTIGRDGPPAECSVLVFVAPTHELADGEAESIVRYIRQGGRALFLLDPGTPESFDKLIASIGIAGGTNIVVDESNRMLGADSFVPQVDRFRSEIFRDRLRAAVILPVARTIRAIAERDEGITIISLAGTNDSSWARTDTKEVPGQDVQFRPQIDDPGPLSVAVSATIESPKATGQVIVVGDSDFATNAHLKTLGNQDFVLALLGILTEDASMIGMRREESADPGRPLSLSAGQTRTIFWVGVVILPGLSILAGLLIGAMRRRQRGGR